MMMARAQKIFTYLKTFFVYSKPHYTLISLRLLLFVIYYFNIRLFDVGVIVVSQIFFYHVCSVFLSLVALLYSGLLTCSTVSCYLLCLTVTFMKTIKKPKGDWSKSLLGTDEREVVPLYTARGKCCIIH